jgi:hypothetical protein
MDALGHQFVSASWRCPYLFVGGRLRTVFNLGPPSHTSMSFSSALEALKAALLLVA